MPTRLPKKILVTGAQGALGEQTVKHFLEQQCQVIGTDRLIREPRLFKETGSITWIQADLSDAQQVRTRIPNDVDAWIDCEASAFLLAPHLIPAMKQKNFGRIVLVGSDLQALTQTLAKEVISHDININAVTPSIIDTPANRHEMPNADFSAWVPLSELAGIIFALTQPWSKSIHGALIPVTGRLL